MCDETPVLHDFKRRALCCACGRAMIESEHINLCTLDYAPTWNFPYSSNLFDKQEVRRALAILCDACIDDKRQPNSAIECSPNWETVVYHPLSELEKLEFQKSYAIELNANGDERIHCLRCGMKSYNPVDIQNKYCGNCHAFHEDQTDQA